VGNPSLAPPDERRLVDALRARDEAAFSTLVRELTPALLRIARLYVASAAVAEDVVQETWVGVLRGIDGFEGRSALRTWIYRILSNTAKTRAVREGRTVPFSALAGDEAAVDPDRFFGADSRFPGHWESPPAAWEGSSRLLERETLAVIEGAIASLPAAQAIVITMRDIEGFATEEVCNALEISETNQRVLLHRARSKVRSALEAYMR
jgi:RNA polymerase sigma-70 factor (ECF subfamily)